jgi:hypothetical protein
MNRVVRCGLLAFVLSVSHQVTLVARDVPLAAGNLLQCTLDEPNLSSHTVKAGDPIVCYARPVTEFGCSLFPHGTQLAGKFVEYRDPGHFVGKGWLKLEFDRVILPEGIVAVGMRIVSVRGFHVNADGDVLGKGHRKRDAAEWTIPILWPEKVVTLPLRGPRPALKGERVITLRLLDDLRLPCGGITTSWLDSAWQFPRPLESSWQYSPKQPQRRSQAEPFRSFRSIVPFDTADSESQKQLGSKQEGSESGDTSQAASDDEINPESSHRTAQITGNDLSSGVPGVTYRRQVVVRSRPSSAVPAQGVLDDSEAASPHWVDYRVPVVLKPDPRPALFWPQTLSPDADPGY